MPSLLITGGAAYPGLAPEAAARLHAFEHAIKLPVDFGMYAFTLANAGVQINQVGPLTVAIFIALFAGKIIGILGLVSLTSKLGLAPLGAQMSLPDVGMISSMASIGLTVALFIAGEAYEQERLQAEAKMGALLSGFMGFVCVGAAHTPCWSRRWAKGADSKKLGAVVSAATRTHMASVFASDDDDDDFEGDDFDDIATIVASNLERSYLLTRSSVLKAHRLMNPDGFSRDGSRRPSREATGQAQSPVVSAV